METGKTRTWGEIADMRIERTSTNFNANLKGRVLQETMDYMERYSNPPKGFYDNSKDLKLTKRIIKAFKSHPSKEDIVVDTFYRKNELFNARGVVSSSKVTLTDTEPARSDSIAPTKNILRRILDPANKNSFNRLVGEEHSGIYENWWNKNIKPIWNDVNDRFRESTCFEGNRDREFNIRFNKQIGVETVKTKPVDELQELEEELNMKQKPQEHRSVWDKLTSAFRDILG